jgi:AcrR family transcriptional regulator
MRKKPVQQRSRQMVDNIIEAAGKVVGEEGLAALTTNRVAEVAGISNGSLYQYFHDRQDLLQALTARVSDDVMALVNTRLPPLPMEGVDARTLVRLAMKLVLDFMRARPLYLELIRNWDEVPLAVFLEPMERFWLHRAQQYLAQTSGGRLVPQLHARFYVQFNGVFFNLLRYASEPTPYVGEDELLDVLADSISLMLMAPEGLSAASGKAN